MYGGRGRAAGTFLLGTAWFLIPLVSRLWDVAYAGTTVLGDFRALGMHPVQYLGIFPRGGEGMAFLENGIMGAGALCPGIAAVILTICYLWTLYEGGYRHQDAENILLWKEKAKKCEKNNLSLKDF